MYVNMIMLLAEIDIIFLSFSLYDVQLCLLSRSHREIVSTEMEVMECIVHTEYDNCAQSPNDMRKIRSLHPSNYFIHL